METSPAHMSMNKTIHCAVRRDLARFRAALDAFVDGDRERAAALHRAWQNFDAQLTDHHEGEHEIAFPAMRAIGISEASITSFDTEHARLTIRGDLTVTYADGRGEVVEERRATSTGRAYWGVSHELLVADFYRTLGDPEPFWIGPAEGVAALVVLDQVYRDAGLAS